MSTAELSKSTCVPCESDVPPLEGKDLQAMYAQLGEPWQLVEDHHLEREYPFHGYPPAVDFTNVVAGIAESQDHHPDILLTWGKATVTIWTHTIDGLTESDFYFAAKVEEAYKSATV